MFGIRLVTFSSNLWETDPQECLRRGILFRHNRYNRNMAIKLVDEPFICRIPMFAWASSDCGIDRIYSIVEIDQHNVHEAIGRENYIKLTGAWEEYFDSKNLFYETEPLSRDETCKYYQFIDHKFYPLSESSPYDNAGPDDEADDPFWDE